MKNKISFFYKIATVKMENEWNKLYAFGYNPKLIWNNWTYYSIENNYNSDYKSFLKWAKERSNITRLTINSLKDALLFISNLNYNKNNIEGKMESFDFNRWKEEIGKIESGGKYTATNKSTNALGKYQFLPRFWWNKIKEFSQSKGKEIENYSDFLNDPELQEAFMEDYTKNNLMKGLQSIRREQDTKYEKAKSLSDGKILALLHFQGLGGARKWLSTGEMIGAENNITVDKYLSKVS